MARSRDLAGWRPWLSPSSLAATCRPAACPSAKDVRPAPDCARCRSAEAALSCSAGLVGGTAGIPPVSASAAWRWSEWPGEGGGEGIGSPPAGGAWSRPASSPLACTGVDTASAGSLCTAGRGRSRGIADGRPARAPISRPGTGRAGVLAVLWTMGSPAEPPGSAGGTGAGPGGAIPRPCRCTGRSGPAGGPPSSGTRGRPRHTAGPGIGSVSPRWRSSAGAGSAGSRWSATDAGEGPAAGGLPASDATSALGSSAGRLAPGTRARATSNGGVAARATTGRSASAGKDGGGGEGGRLPAPGCSYPGPAGRPATPGGARGCPSLAPSGGRARTSLTGACGSPTCRWRRSSSPSSGSPARGLVVAGSSGWGERPTPTSGPASAAGAASAAEAGICSRGWRRRPGLGAGAVAGDTGSSARTFPLPGAGGRTDGVRSSPRSSWKCASSARRCPVAAGEVVVGS